MVEGEREMTLSIVAKMSKSSESDVDATTMTRHRDDDGGNAR